MGRVNKGVRFEYKIKKELEKEGYYVIRSAGSHGHFDLVAMHPVSRKILLCQLKRGSRQYVESQRKLYDDLGLSGPFLAEFKMIEKIDHKK